MSAFVDHAGPRATSATGTAYLTLFPVPVVCFVAALATDIAYWASAFLMWLHFSEWLIAAGLAFGAVAAVLLLIAFVANRETRSRPRAWWHLGLFYAALVVELFNAFVHTIDGWTAVVPTGMALSVVGGALALGAVAALFAMSSPPVVRREAL